MLRDISQTQADIVFSCADGLVLQASDCAGPLLERFYAGYDRAFILPDEKEDLEGFRACLALNHGPQGRALAERHGRFREYVALFHDEGMPGEPVGGANFIAFFHEDAGANPAISVALNYLYVDATRRGRGYLRKAMATLAAFVPVAMGETDAVLPAIFIEQNDPLAMDAADYARDSAHSGTDQFARLAIWTRMGARIIDHDYVQPPLSDAQAPEDGLLLAVMNYAGEGLDHGIDPCYLATHLERFFSISVLKGRPARGIPPVAAQLESLDGACTDHRPITLLDCPPDARTLAQTSSAANLRDLLRAAG